MIFLSKQKDKLINKVFNSNEIKIINDKIKKIKLDHIIYCSFENRFAKSGGLGAVTQVILPYLDSFNFKTKAILITPYYSNIIKDRNIKRKNIIFYVPFGNKNIKTEAWEYTLEYNLPKYGTLKEYYIKADGFFNSKNRLNDPYIYDEDNLETNNEKLITNSLFFCKAVPYLLKKLKITKNILFHLQDWHTSLITLTSKEALLNKILDSSKTTLTLHNSFDVFTGEKLLKMITDRVEQLNEFTVLRIALQFADTPVTTVSKFYAKEFTKDIIQKEYFTPHLQRIFKQNKIIGVNNGKFVNSPEKYKNIGEIGPDGIKKIKIEFRKNLLKIIDQYPVSEYFGKLDYKGKSIINLPDEIPIFVMSGRLDFTQKGYDIFLHALKRFGKDKIKAILTPKPVKEKDLYTFKKIAKECHGNIIVFPKNMTHGFNELQMGSTFGVMPSIYEPFGAAIEYMVRGTVVIARETGGLKNQIDKNCGILYRESYENYNLENIINLSKTGDNVKKRLGNKWVIDMVESLYDALNKAKKVYLENPHEYYQMIKNGFVKSKKFDWNKSAKEYFKVYKK